MKLKYYLRGLGIGIIVTTLILMVSFSGRDTDMSDDEVIARARQLGMVMPDEQETDGQDTEEQEDGADTGDPAGDDGAGNPAGEADGGVDTGNPAGGSGDGEPLAAGNPGETNRVDVGVGDTADPGETEIYRLTVRRGDVCRIVCENLAANGVESDAEEMRQYLLQIGYASHISVGDYDIPFGLTNEEVAEILKAGPMEKE